MQLKVRLLVVWALYSTLLIIGTGSYRGNIAQMVIIALGTLFGMLLPKLICALSELLSQEKVVLDGPTLRTFAQTMVHDPLVERPKTQTGQMIYSYPFLFAFALISLYIVTSSSVWFGKAVVLGMGLRLCIDIVMSGQDKTRLRERWFSIYQTRLSDSELSFFVYGSIVVWVALTIFSLIS